MTKETSNKHTTFFSNDGLVRVKLTTRPRRWPPHNFPVAVVELRPKPGTRVLPLPGAGIEWMPRFGEVLDLILKMGLQVLETPADKPEERRLRFAEINARRHATRSK